MLTIFKKFENVKSVNKYKGEYGVEEECFFLKKDESESLMKGAYRESGEVDEIRNSVE